MLKTSNFKDLWFNYNTENPIIVIIHSECYRGFHITRISAVVIIGRRTLFNYLRCQFYLQNRSTVIYILRIMTFILIPDTLSTMKHSIILA